MNIPYVMYGFPNPYLSYMPRCTCRYSQPAYGGYPPAPNNPSQFPPLFNHEDKTNLRLFDHGNKPFVVNIHQAAKQNKNFRTTLWTGDYLQVTLMNIGAGEDVGLEVHEDDDQFLRIEEGQGLVQMGDRKEHLTFVKFVKENDAIFVPAGTWHNLTNTGNTPLKLYSIYAPPNHPFNTVHQTKADEEH